MLKKLNPLFWVLLALAFFCLSLAVAARFAAPASVTLSFTVEGNVTQLELAPGETPDVSALETAGEGLRFVCWLDALGGEAEPEQPAEHDAAYTALIAPELTQDMQPWLSHDSLGRLYPDELISGAELAAGVSALFDGAYEAPGLAALSTAGERDLAAALRGAFSESELAGLDGTEPMTRLEAAAAIVRLAGLELPACESAPAPDLAADRPGAAALAACAGPEGAASYPSGPVIIGGSFYYVDEDGLFVTDTLIDGMYFDETGCCPASGYEPGPVNIAGYLYYVDEDGGFVVNEERGGISYGPNGRYSSGSEELDALVAEVLAPICEEYGSRNEMLRAAYDYVRDGFQYLRRNFYDLGETGWEVEEALTMLSTGRGNCYNYAAAFWALARGLGYDAQAISGTMGWDYERHGWVVIYDESGTRLTYDTETEMAYRRDGVYNRDMFAMSPAFAAGWNYKYGA